MIAFGWASLWSSVSSALLVGLYAGSILGWGRQGLAFGAVMGVYVWLPLYRIASPGFCFAGRLGFRVFGLGLSHVPDA